MIIRTLALISVLFIAGCASTPQMNIATNQTIPQASQDEAQVIFLRSSGLGRVIAASLYDVTDGNIEFIGIINNSTKVPYTTKPGKRTFMVVSEAADFMEAELVPGKNFFSLVTPRMGAWKARFSLWPIKNDANADYHTGMPEYTKWMESTKLVENTEQANTWYEKNKASTKAKYDKYWPVWQQKSKEDIARRTLTPSDGM